MSEAWDVIYKIIILAIVVVWYIVSSIKKAKKKAQNKKAETQIHKTMPNSREKVSDEKSMEEFFKDIFGETLPEPVSKKPIAHEIVVEKKKKPKKVQIAASAKKEDYPHILGIPSGNKTQDIMHEKPIVKVSSNQFVQAVVWSEILSPAKGLRD
ncbi:MAG: hypothetical protein OEV44_06815 [Spirochaetota bacterium]|nr:hypothetical protein [Spirochaetota bacterium]